MRGAGRTPGLEPDLFGDRLARSRRTEGELNQFILADYPLTHIYNPRTFIPSDFPGSTLLWIDGDGDMPTIGPPGLTLPATGAPVSGGALPLRPTEAGGTLTAEHYDGAADYRTSTDPVDPGDGEDICITYLCTADLLAAVVANQHLISTLTPGDLTGFRIYFDGVATWYLQFGVAGALVWSYDLTMHAGMPQLYSWVLRRSDGHCWIYECGEYGKDAAPFGGFGSIAGGHNLQVANLAGGALFHGSLALLDIRSMAGGAAVWTADWVRRYHHRILGHYPRSGAPIGSLRAQYASEIRDGEWWPIADDWPRIQASGMLFEPGRTNICEGKNLNPLGAPVAPSGWAVSAGSLDTVDDSAALAAAAVPAHRWGPRVARHVNATGVTQILISLGIVQVAVSYVGQCLARMAAGAGARFGWWSAALGFTDVCAVADNYARTFFENITPPAADCYLAWQVPNGCTLHVVAEDATPGTVLCNPIPNSFGQNTPSDQLYLCDVADNRGRITMDLTVERAPAGDAVSYLMGRSIAGQLLVQRHTASWGAEVRARVHDGTNYTTSPVNLADGAEHHIEIDWQATCVLTIDGVATAGLYDGAWQGVGDEQIANVGSNGGIAVRVRNVRYFRNSRCA